MNQKHVFSTVVITAGLMVAAAFSFQDRAATWASQPNTSPNDGKDSVAGQIKELQKQVAELQARVGQPRIVAAGTATWKCPNLQRNDTSTRVNLPRDVVAGLGKDFIVLLTPRLPGGDPYFVPHWKLASDGFDITPVDTAVTATTPAEYAVKRTYLIDWAVIKK